MEAGSRSTWVAGFATLLLGALAFAVYVSSPDEGTFTDPKYAWLSSESLLLRRSWDVSPYIPSLREPPAPVPAHTSSASREPEPGGSPRRPAPLPYQLARDGSRLVYIYPPGTPLLSAPFVAVLRGLGYSALDDHGTYSHVLERRAQKVLAAFLAALTAAVLFRLARRELPLLHALAAAALVAFGSGLWSTASRSLWSHTWTVLLGALALLELVRWEDGEKRRPVLLGLLLVAAFWTRPTNALAVAALTVFVALRHRAALPRLVAVGALGLLGYVAHSLALWGVPLPPYMSFGRALGHGSYVEGGAGLLVSPERGLLLASPILLAVLWILARRGAPRARRSLTALAGLVCLGYLALYASWPTWYGGGTPGPRYLTDVVPFLALLGALAWRAARETRRAASAVSRTPSLLLVWLLGLATFAGQYASVHHRRVVYSPPRSPSSRAAGAAAPAGPYSLEAWRGAPQALFVRRVLLGRPMRNRLLAVRQRLTLAAILPNPAVSLAVHPSLVGRREPLLVEVGAPGLDGQPLELEARDAIGSLLARAEVTPRAGRASAWLYPDGPAVPGDVRVRVRAPAQRFRSEWREQVVALEPGRAPLRARLLDGMHPRERTPEESFQWTKERASGAFARPAGDAILHLLYRCAGEAERTATLHVEGMPSVSLTCGTDAAQVARVAVPRAATASGPVRFEIQVTPGFRASDGASQDARVLGLQVLDLLVSDRPAGDGQRPATW